MHTIKWPQLLQAAASLFIVKTNKDISNYQKAPKMPTQYQQWLNKMNYSHPKAAAALGIGIATSKRYATSGNDKNRNAQSPKLSTRLAMAALANNTKPWSE